ncbi:hypothetical protein [Mesomycoplasma hyorhinis]|uniref:hypothetical protein n=1 Tax=Mesomycoplasma hyorhinis TaxID=2100 RepID=UPI001C04857F|nr:hypothetical protein [Mesomycoplasma hyorhinis]
MKIKIKRFLTRIVPIFALLSSTWILGMSAAVKKEEAEYEVNYASLYEEVNFLEDLDKYKALDENKIVILKYKDEQWTNNGLSEHIKVITKISPKSIVEVKEFATSDEWFKILDEINPKTTKFVLHLYNDVPFFSDVDSPANLQNNFLTYLFYTKGLINIFNKNANSKLAWDTNNIVLVGTYGSYKNDKFLPGQTQNLYKTNFSNNNNGIIQPNIFIPKISFKKEEKIETSYDPKLSATVFAALASKLNMLVETKQSYINKNLKILNAIYASAKQFEKRNISFNGFDTQLGLGKFNFSGAWEILNKDENNPEIISNKKSKDFIYEFELDKDQQIQASILFVKINFSFDPDPRYFNIWKIIAIPFKIQINFWETLFSGKNVSENIFKDIFVRNEAFDIYLEKFIGQWEKVAFSNSLKSNVEKITYKSDMKTKYRIVIKPEKLIYTLEDSYFNLAILKK